jgi:hypothetical protein
LMENLSVAFHPCPMQRLTMLVQRMEKLLNLLLSQNTCRDLNYFGIKKPS